MSKLAQDDEEDDETGDPRPELVSMHHLVPEQRDEKRAGSDDDDARVPRHVSIHRIDQLSAHNDVDSRPANAGQDVEDRNHFDAVEAEEVAGQHHLAKAKPRTKCREECNGRDGQAIDEEDGEEGIDKAQLEDRNG